MTFKTLIGYSIFAFFFWLFAGSIECAILQTKRNWDKKKAIDHGSRVFLRGFVTTVFLLIIWYIWS